MLNNVMSITFQNKKIIKNRPLFQHPSIFIPVLDNFLCFSGSGTIASMLEPHLKNDAGGSQMEVGVAFFIIGGFYTFSAIVTGMVSYFSNVLL